MDEPKPSLAEPDAAPPEKSRQGGAFRLAWWIIAAIVAAILFAFAYPEGAAKLHLGGQAFLRLLKMIVVPLVMASVMSGVIAMGDIRRLGRPCALVLVYFLGTTTLAVTIGLLVANLLRPGAAYPADELEKVGQTAESSADAAGPDAAPPAAEETKKLGDAFEEFVLKLCPDSLFGAMAEGNLLPLILFSIIFAGVLTTMGRKSETISSVITGANQALLKLVMLLMKIAPIGIFCLVAAQFGREIAQEKFEETFLRMLSYILTVAVGVGVHLFIVLPLILFLITRRSPYRFMFQMLEALLTAFSTSSSSATLPVTMECATNRAGVSQRSADFVLPLGTTVNMDGTAIYQACAALFLAQAHGIDLGLMEQLTIVLTAVLASIGTPGIPQGGLVALLIVVGAVGLPAEGMVMALIVSVDWLVDRLRTMVNVFGDATAAAVVERTFQT